MKYAKLLAVGKLKTPHWQDAAAHYVKRLAPTLRVEEIIVKDGDSKLPQQARNKQEGERLLKAVRPGDVLLCLDEHGKTYTSEAFSNLLRTLYDRGQTPCFIIGGAFGLDASVTEAASSLLSLSPMTFPHEMARVVLFEQLYRTEQILAGTGYHH